MILPIVNEIAFGVEDGVIKLAIGHCGPKMLRYTCASNFATC